MANIGSLEKFKQSLLDVSLAMTEMVTTFRLYFGVPAWKQHEDETFLAWGERLNRDGYLDNPYIRWQYQKATFRWLFTPFRLLGLFTPDDDDNTSFTIEIKDD